MQGSGSGRRLWAYTYACARCVCVRACMCDKQASLWAWLLSPEPGEQISNNNHSNNK